MSEEQAEKNRGVRRVANMPTEKHEKIKASRRNANLTAEQIKNKRAERRAAAARRKANPDAAQVLKDLSASEINTKDGVQKSTA